MADYGVLIVGGGPVAAALALALRGSGLAVGLLEAQPPDAVRTDPRPIALSHGSRLILERLGVWDELGAVTPIARIHVSQRAGFGRVELDAEEARLPALGYVLDYATLAGTLAGKLGAGTCDYLTGAAVTAVEGRPEAARVHFDNGGGVRRYSARLVVIAGGEAMTAITGARIWDYRQAAVTARVWGRVPHRNVAYERFTPAGPLALLPLGQALALIWTTSPGHAQELCALSEVAFLRQLQHAFGQRLGAFTGASVRAWFPLALKVADPVAAPRIFAVGNAAQTLHPVAGQGLNLGLRDAWELAGVIRDSDPGQIGEAAMSNAYAARRRLDRGGGVWFTDTLVRLFSNDIAPLRLARGLALVLLGAAPPLKEFVVRRMTFGARG